MSKVKDYMLDLQLEEKERQIQEEMYHDQYMAEIFAEKDREIDDLKFKLEQAVSYNEYLEKMLGLKNGRE